MRKTVIAVMVSAISFAAVADGVDVNDLQVRQDQIVQVVTAHEDRLTDAENVLATTETAVNKNTSDIAETNRVVGLVSGAVQTEAARVTRVQNQSLDNRNDIASHDSRITTLESRTPEAGPKGDTGAQGEQGAQGVAGKDGAAGSISKKQMTQINKNTSAVNQLYAEENDLIDAHNENVAAIDDNTAHISKLEQSTNQRFADMGKRVDDNRKRAAVGVAGVAAMANIPQVTDSQSVSVGAGVGDYDSQQAVAVGFSVRVSQHIVTKAAVSAGSFGGAAVGAGMSWGW